jgi:hypothetical protein
MKKSLIVLLVAVSGVLMSASAQDEGPFYVAIRIDTVKPDRIDQWESRIKELRDANEAVKRPFFHVFQRLRGPAWTYLIFTPFTEIGGDGDGVSMPPSWGAEIRSNVSGSNVVTLQVHSDLWTTESESSAPLTEYMTSFARTIAPGRSDDYLEYLTETAMPEFKKAGFRDLRVLQVAQGGNTNMWVFFNFVDGWPPQEDLLAKSMGERDARRMIENLQSYESTGFNYLYRFRSDLSYTADQ